MSDDETNTTPEDEGNASGNRWEAEADTDAFDDHDTDEIHSPVEGRTPALRKPRVLAGSVAAAMVLVGLGGFGIGHASAGDGDGDAQPSSQSDAQPGEDRGQGRGDGRGGPLGGQQGGQQGGPGSDPRLDEPDSVTEDSSAT